MCYLTKNTTNEEFQVFTKIASIGFNWFGNGEYGDLIIPRPIYPPYVEDSTKGLKQKDEIHYDKIIELYNIY